MIEDLLHGKVIRPGGDLIPVGCMEGFRAYKPPVRSETVALTVYVAHTRCVR